MKQRGYSGNLLQTLLALGLLIQTATTELRREFVRVTRYDLSGTMRDGTSVYLGAAACSEGKAGSLNFPRGSILEFEDGRQVVCEDTGLGDYYWKGWVDVWSIQRLPYADYEWVSVIRRGWNDD